jgi:hypothetical protein
MYLSVHYSNTSSSAALGSGGPQPPLELGALAVSLPFDQLFMERTLEQVAVQVGTTGSIRQLHVTLRPGCYIIYSQT